VNVYSKYSDVACSLRQIVERSSLP